MDPSLVMRRQIQIFTLRDSRLGPPYCGEAATCCGNPQGEWGYPGFVMSTSSPGSTTDEGDECAVGCTAAVLTIFEECRAWNVIAYGKKARRAARSRRAEGAPLHHGCAPVASAEVRTALSYPPVNPSRAPGTEC